MLRVIEYTGEKMADTSWSFLLILIEKDLDNLIGFLHSFPCVLNEEEKAVREHCIDKLEQVGIKKNQLSENLNYALKNIEKKLPRILWKKTRVSYSS